MEYHFNITIHTDGDFHFPFVPSGMKDDGYEFYMLDKSYQDRSEAIKDIVSICTFLKEQMFTYKDYVRDQFNRCINTFLDRLCSSNGTEHEYIDEYMNGNYDGTEFVFKSIPHSFKFELRLTDEEYELIHKTKKDVSMGMLHDAVLALFKEVK